MLLAEKVIVVSGVGRGLGQAMARLAAAEGAAVVLGARDGAYIEALATRIADAGGRAIARATDVGDAAQCRALADAAVAAFGGIDGLVNSAYAHGGWATTAVADPADFAAAFDVNCIGALRMAQACLPALERARGAIVNVSTMSTVAPFPGEGAYAAGKGGLGVLTRHMAHDFGRLGVRVNTARMGWIGGAPVAEHIDAQIAGGADRAALMRTITDRIPLGEIPPEDDCARAILFLVSDYARVVSGATLDINGGQYMTP